MTPSWGVVVLAALSVCCFLVARKRANREFAVHQRLSSAAVGYLFVTFTGLTIAIVATAIFGMWQIPTGSAARVGGGLLVAAGFLLYVSARWTMKSLRSTWGLTLDKLLTTGPYSFTRNPQLTGAIGLLLGVALIGRSGTAMLLVALYCAIATTWITVEERALETRFGDRYRDYRRRVPRFF